MAIYNEILTGRYARMLQKLFGMKGSVPTKQLAGEITTTINLFSGVELRYLEQWDRFGLALQVIGVAGNVSGIRFRNPVGSNVVAVFESLFVGNDSTTAGDYFVSLGAIAADLASPSSLVGSRLDPRGRNAPTLIVSSQATTPSIGFLTAGIARPVLATTVTLQIISTENQEITVLPGDALQVLTFNLTSSVDVSAVWRERLLEESERT